MVPCCRKGDPLWPATPSNIYSTFADNVQGFLIEKICIPFGVVPRLKKGEVLLRNAISSQAIDGSGWGQRGLGTKPSQLVEA